MKVKLPVEWAVFGTVEVEADSIEEAVKKFHEIEDDLPLPTDSYYIDGTFRLSTQDTKSEEANFSYYKELYNSDAPVHAEPEPKVESENSTFESEEEQLKYLLNYCNFKFYRPIFLRDNFHYKEVIFSCSRSQIPEASVDWCTNSCLNSDGCLVYKAAKDAEAIVNGDVA